MPMSRGLQDWMMALATIAVALLAPTPVTAAVHTGSLTWQNLERTYTIVVPQTAIDHPNRVRRALFVLHGLGNTGAGIRSETRRGFEALAERDDVLVVYPDGYNSAWTSALSPERTIDDAGFIAALADRCAARWNSDSDHLWITGSSNGGIASYHVAQLLNDRVAGIAPVIAQIPDPDRDGAAYFDLPLPVPTVAFCGTADAIFPYDGGLVAIGDTDFGHVISAPASLALVARSNGLSGGSSGTLLPDRVTDGTRVEHIVAAGGDRGTATELYRIIGGAHLWPDGANTQPTGSDINACDLIWRFFTDSARPAAAHRTISIAVVAAEATSRDWQCLPASPYVGSDVAAHTELSIFAQLDPGTDHRLQPAPAVSH